MQIHSKLLSQRVWWYAPTEVEVEQNFCCLLLPALWLFWWLWTKKLMKWKWSSWKRVQHVQCYRRLEKFNMLHDADQCPKIKCTADYVTSSLPWTYTMEVFYLMLPGINHPTMINQGRIDVTMTNQILATLEIYVLVSASESSHLGLLRDEEMRHWNVVPMSFSSNGWFIVWTKQWMFN